MDFGEILKKWEDNNKIYDKDANASENERPQENKQRFLKNKPDAILDIHGSTSEKAWTLLDQFFNNAKSSDFKKLRIIHGKGNHSQGEAILKNIVREFIEKCPFAGKSGYEKAINGGTGATWVLLKYN
jgi:DNA-nicking Smr family endonuclease